MKVMIYTRPRSWQTCISKVRWLDATDRNDSIEKLNRYKNPVLYIDPHFFLYFFNETFCSTQENSLSRMSVGIKLHQDLLGALAAQLVGLDDLRADLRDLLTQITKVQAAHTHTHTHTHPTLATCQQTNMHL